jgi:hypothetical protein
MTVSDCRKNFVMQVNCVPTDLNTRMPRSEAEAIFDIIKPIGQILHSIQGGFSTCPLLLQLFGLILDYSSRLWAVSGGE